MDATTSAIFNAMGISSTTLTLSLNTGFAQSFYFFLYSFQAFWPYYLIVGFVSIGISLCFVFLFTGWGRNRIGRRER